ncbi:MAG: hypothetical protein ACI33M_14150 [Lysinibacillus sp.]
MSEELKRSIKGLYEDLPSPDLEKKRAVIQQSKQLIQQAPPESMSLFSFYFQQLRFIRPRTWTLQFLIVILAALLIMNAPNTRTIIALTSAVSPFIYLVSFSELIRSYAHRVFELELTTKYSYKTVMLARIGLMNILNIFAITLLVFTVVKTSQLAMLQTFFFVCIPFLLTSILGLWILQWQHTKESYQWVYIAGVFFGICLMLVIYLYPQLFLAISNGLWWSIMLIATGTVIYQYRQLINGISLQIEKLQV